MERWCGKVAIVTGASAGIGASIAEKLVEAGVIVAGLARRVDRIQSLADRLSHHRGKLHALQADVRLEEDVVRSFKWVKENLGPIHILVNNAGIVRNTSLINGDAELWRQTFDTNVLGLSIATREAVKDMRANGVVGQIIHINSILGHIVPYIENFNVYIGSKHAVTALTETLRQELNAIGSKIKISMVSPGVVDTEFPLDSESLAKQWKQIAHLSADDVANAVMYVLSTPPHVQIHDIIIKPVGEVF
ncbi:farnesol dehydrogenase-like [Photinus pyralis]|uniref:farnesol dehydrogenase-like n=1 Tax=Photinus pyralis TaxID=7054 RepID=UPI001266FEC1|nr:farnesol dehydrogenase-like [Photinus pyralis]